MQKSTGIHPLTKTSIFISLPGHALYGKESAEFYYKDGKIGCNDGSKKVEAKLEEIARYFNASLVV